MPFTSGSIAPPMGTHPGIKGSDFSNPTADALNKKRKKIRANPSMLGLKAATSSKPPMSEGMPGAGVGGNL